jgi:hypothetical protein
VTPEEARALLDMALHSPIMRAVIEANPPPKMTPEQADRLRRIFTAQARDDARAAREEEAGPSG